MEDQTSKPEPYETLRIVLVHETESGNDSNSEKIDQIRRTIGHLTHPQ